MKSKLRKASVSDEHAAPTAVRRSKSAKKRRRKKGSSCQVKTADSDRYTASMKVSQSNSVDRMNGVKVCSHEVVKIEYRGNIVRIVCPLCTEEPNVPKIDKSELAIKPDDVSTSVASSDDGQILATQLGESKCDEGPAVGNDAACQHRLGETHGPEIEKPRKPRTRLRKTVQRGPQA